MTSKKTEGRVDLHTHTIASDGLLSPSRLIEYAYLKGLQAVAITDHDTTDGIDEGISAGKRYKVDVIPGIELNSQIDNQEIHILGYYIDKNSQQLQDVLSKMRDSRKIRTEKMVDKLVELYGFPISFDDILNQVQGETIGRPHIARMLVSKGLINNEKEAFEKYIGTDCPAYIGRYRITPTEAIELIKNAGGVSVLAHPGLLPDPGLMEKVLNLGIQGIEAYHSKHTQEQADYYSTVANSHGLVITGGSDCHGELFNGLPIIGDVFVDIEIVDELRRLASLRHSRIE